MADKKDEYIGALWEKTANSGMKFFCGVIKVEGKEIDIVAFKNKYKTDGDNKPEWNILKGRKSSQSREVEEKHENDSNQYDNSDEVPF